MALTILRAACLAMVVWGAGQTVSTVFNFADAAMGLMAVINLTAILLLSGTVYRLTQDYFSQRRQGKEPTFVLNEFEGAKNGINATIWTEDPHAERT